MFWAYVGGGCWEWQLGLLLGCVYGNKFGPEKKLTVEVVVRDETTQAQVAKTLWEERVEMADEEAMVRVEAQVEHLLRREVERLQVGARRR